MDLDYGYRQCPAGDEEALKRLIDMVKCEGMRVLEIGCWSGRSTSVICGKIKGFGTLTVIDWFKGNREKTRLDDHKGDVEGIFRGNMEELGYMGIIDLYVADSREVSHIFEDKSFDLVFIDASHDYESVKKDIELYYPKVKEEGILCGHDYDVTHKGVMDAVDEVFKKVDKDGRVWWKKNTIKC